MNKTRPKHLALWQIRLPLPGIVSILHRISGILLFLAIPFLLYLLQGSLASEKAFEQYRVVMTYPIVKGALLLIVWACFHHACAGIRFLLLDIHLGLSLNKARMTANIVMLVSGLCTLIVGVMIW